MAKRDNGERRPARRSGARFLPGAPYLILLSSSSGAKAPILYSYLYDAAKAAPFQTESLNCILTARLKLRPFKAKSFSSLFKAKFFAALSKQNSSQRFKANFSS